MHENFVDKPTIVIVKSKANRVAYAYTSVGLQKGLLKEPVTDSKAFLASVDLKETYACK